ncbi:MAG: YaaA family protein [Atopobiaceae bacterium]|nr:YaaA family protein [Atopobiaceae bacterium]
MDYCLIASPAKKMDKIEGPPYIEGYPCFLDRTEEIAARLRGLSFSEAKRVWSCSDELASLNYERHQHMDLLANPSPAVLAYEGIQFTHLAAGVLDEGSIEWLQAHYRIISGFYGLVRPLDGIQPYRLEMQAKLSVGDAKDLYRYWGDTIARELSKDFDTVVDIASVEYSKAVVPHARDLGMRIVEVKFGVMKGGAFRQPSTEAKAARGCFARWCAENRIDDPSAFPGFTERGYRLNGGRSTPTELCFVRE